MLTILTLNLEKWKIYETLGGLNLYQQSTDSEKKSAALLKFIFHIGLVRQVWVFAMMDIDSVDTCAINSLVEDFEEVLVKGIRCLLHFMNLVGDKMMKCDELKKVMK